MDSYSIKEGSTKIGCAKDGRIKIRTPRDGSVNEGSTKGHNTTIVSTKEGSKKIGNVVGSYPSAVYWMDIFSHLFVVKIVMFEKAKIYEKEAGEVQFKKRYVVKMKVVHKMSV